LGLLCTGLGDAQVAAFVIAVATVEVLTIAAFGGCTDRCNRNPKPFIGTVKDNDIIERVTRA
jgi:hypothetical protein